MQHARGVRLDQEMLQSRRFRSQYRIGPAFDELLQIAIVDFVPKDDCRQLCLSFVGKVSSTGKQLMADPLYSSGRLFSQYPYAFVFHRLLLFQCLLD